MAGKRRHDSFVEFGTSLTGLEKRPARDARVEEAFI